MTERDSARQLGGALGWGIASRLARTLLGLFGTYLVLNMLTPREFGTLSLVRNFLAYLTIVVGAGLSQGLLRYLPAWRLSAGRSRMRMALFASFAVHVVLWALVTLVLFLLKPWIGEVTNEVVAGLVVLGVALLLPEVFGHTATNIANAYYDTRNISVAVVITTITYVVALALLLKQGLGPSGVLIAAAISNVVLTLVLLSKVPRYLN
ncbi:MAG: oligosaccharide flippase family protein, partial [Candidatus Eisenbacteria bacterium]|nr:oligosaccharide flippase family protein [Candidatus Eisenbacteria bacterium]